MASRVHLWLNAPVKLFFTGDVIKAELLVMMLEKHGIAATQEFVDPAQPDDGDLNRLAKVFCAGNGLRPRPSIVLRRARG